MANERTRIVTLAVNSARDVCKKSLLLPISYLIALSSQTFLRLQRSEMI